MLYEGNTRKEIGGFWAEMVEWPSRRFHTAIVLLNLR